MPNEPAFEQKSGDLWRVLFSFAVTAAVGVSAYFAIRFLIGL
ncbi:hypothetical protein ACVSQB_14995 [Bradyrhizobium elkanii]